MMRHVTKVRVLALKVCSSPVYGRRRNLDNMRAEWKIFLRTAGLTIDHRPWSAVDGPWSIVGIPSHYLA